MSLSEDDPRLARWRRHKAALSDLDDEDRLAYLVALARAARQRPFPDALKVDDHLLHGCMSKVWIIAEPGEQAGEIQWHGYSDARLVHGLVCLMLDAFGGLDPAALRQVSLDHVRAFDLGAMTTRRQVGLMAMLKQMQRLARRL